MEVAGPTCRPEFAGALDTMARRVLGGPIDALRRLTGGASQETWSFDVPAARDPAHILRRTPPGDQMNRDDSIDPEREAAVIVAMAARGVAVPRVFHVLEPTDGLGRGFVMARIDGEAMGRRIVHGERFAAARRSLTGQCGRALATVHATSLDSLPTLPKRSPDAAIDLLERQLRAARDPRPVFEAALRWLRQHCPANGTEALVHGDFRTGNILVADHGLSAVLDWEGCHIGDPVADLGWLCMPVWRFGRLDLPCGGFGTREALVAGYGTAVDPARLWFWEVFGMLRWGLTCVAMATAFRHGERSIERAAVGRRASEAELELVNALMRGMD